MLALIYVLLDKESYHYDKLVQEWLEMKGRSIKLHFITKY